MSARRSGATDEGMTIMNARERLADAAEWLGWNDEDLSAGLRNAFDGLRLYDYAQTHPDLPEMADEWEPGDRVAILGYDPLAEGRETYHEAETSGAMQAAIVLEMAKDLLVSVAFVAKEGDAEEVINAIDAVI